MSKITSDWLTAAFESNPDTDGLSPLASRPSMRSSASVVLIRNGKIAAIRSAKHNGALELPGGKSEPGESPFINAMRECREEVGVWPCIVRLLLTEPVGGFMCSTYLGSIEDALQLVSSEEGEAGWFTPEELLTGTYADHTAKWLPMVAEELSVHSADTSNR